MPGFGGPLIYRATAQPARTLDLRTNPWSVLAEQFGLDRADYGAGELDHELIWSLSRTLAAGGYDWAVVAVAHPSGLHDEWLYLGDADLVVERVP